MKPAHRRGNYQTLARQVVAAAKANPDAVCWRDGLPLDHHPPHKDGRPPFWTAGHSIDGNAAPWPWLNVTRRPPPGNWLAPEASVCNYSHGSKTASNPHSRRW